MKFLVLLFLVAFALAKDGDDGEGSRPYVHTVAKHGVQPHQHKQCSVDLDCRDICHLKLPNTALVMCYEGACFCMVPNT